MIRNEQPTDHRRVEEITREAFWNLYRPGCDEHFIVHAMRGHTDYIPELAFVIEHEGAVAGSIVYTRSKIAGENGEATEVVTFGPVGIVPELQAKGLGRALIEHSLAAAREAGYRAVVIGGYPACYRKYGFAGAKKYGISMPDGRFYTGIQALPLYEGALDGVRGTLLFSEVFVTDEETVERFDAGFPPKEKQFQESQAAFQRAAAEIDPQTYGG